MSFESNMTLLCDRTRPLKVNPPGVGGTSSDVCVTRLKRDGRFMPLVTLRPRDVDIDKEGVRGGPGVYGVDSSDAVAVAGVAIDAASLAEGRVRDKERRFGFERFMHSTGGSEGGDEVRMVGGIEVAAAGSGDGDVFTGGWT